MRTRSTLILVGSFLAIIIKLKQTGCAILVAFLQWAVFRVSCVWFVCAFLFPVPVESD